MRRSGLLNEFQIPMASVTVATTSAQTQFSERSKAPVFVLGCPRSGTTLLYHMLLSTGSFAIYTTESQAFNLLEPRFGSLQFERNRHRLLKEWGDSSLFFCTGLNLVDIEKATAECPNVGEFLRVVMESMVRAQGVQRWADCTPDHVLALRRIKETIPDALVIHIIRDGRDVALSLAKQRWIRPLPWDQDKSLHCAALFWEWIVTTGRKQGATMPERYLEIRYEELIRVPTSVLNEVGDFIGQQLDYAQIRDVGYGSLRRPNSSFGKETTVGLGSQARWKTSLSQEQLTEIQNLIGGTLVELGYPLSGNARTIPVRLRRKRIVYRAFLGSKLFLKTKTPLGRFFTGDLRLLGLQAKGPSYASDALREPVRIWQIPPGDSYCENHQDWEHRVREELISRGHFCGILKHKRNVTEESFGVGRRNSTPAVLQSILKYAFRGCLLNPHIRDFSRRDSYLAIWSAAMGLLTRHGALITFRGKIPHDTDVSGRRRFDRIVLAMLGMAHEFSCDRVETRNTLERRGIAPEKIRLITRPSTMADWLTGDFSSDDIPEHPTIR